MEWQQNDGARLVHLLPEQEPPVGAAEADHLDPMFAAVRPIQGIGEPVNGQALRALQTAADHLSLGNTDIRRPFVVAIPAQYLLVC